MEQDVKPQQFQMERDVELSDCGTLLPRQHGAAAGEMCSSACYYSSHTSDWAWSTSSTVDTYSNTQDTQEVVC